MPKIKESKIKKNKQGNTTDRRGHPPHIGKEVLLAACTKAARRYKLCFFAEVVRKVKYSKATLYNPDYAINKDESLLEILENNRISRKEKMRNNWETSASPGLQVAAYKLLGTPEEVQILNNSKQSINLHVDLTSMSDEELERIATGKA